MEICRSAEKRSAHEIVASFGRPNWRSARQGDSWNVMLANTCWLMLSLIAPIGLAGLGQTAVGQAHASRQSAFDVVSIKPASGDGNLNIRWYCDRFIASTVSVERLINTAYGLWPGQLEDLPSWAKSETFMVEATIPPQTANIQPSQRGNVNRQMLQSMLKDRFALTVHKATERLPVYEVRVANGGPKLNR